MIYPRKRPIDGQVVYFREQELEDLEEQRAIASGNYEVFLAQRQRREDARAKLRAKFGREPSDSDVSWPIFNEDIVNEAKAGELGLYRNTKLSMAQMLQRENKTKQALQSFLEVAILDMNGATNIVSGLSEAEMHEFGVKPYDLQYADLLGYVIGEIEECATESRTSDAELEALFAAAWNRIPARSKLPLDQGAGWSKLRETLAAHSTED